MSEKPRYTVSSGNVFADLGLPNADELLARADLAIQISRIIDERGLTQAQAAEILGIDQPKISALVRGRLGGFSMERLYRYLNALGSDVEIIVRPKPRNRPEGVVRVLTHKSAVATAAKTSHHGAKSKTTTRKAASRRPKRNE
jgi:predicted XRE-type DNA-binding protein